MSHCHALRDAPPPGHPGPHSDRQGGSRSPARRPSGVNLTATTPAANLSGALVCSRSKDFFISHRARPDKGLVNQASLVFGLSIVARG